MQKEIAVEQTKRLATPWSAVVKSSQTSEKSDQSNVSEGYAPSSTLKQSPSSRSMPKTSHPSMDSMKSGDGSILENGSGEVPPADTRNAGTSSESTPEVRIVINCYKEEKDLFLNRLTYPDILSAVKSNKAGSMEAAREAA